MKECVKKYFVRNPQMKKNFFEGRKEISYNKEKIAFKKFIKNANLF